MADPMHQFQIQKIVELPTVTVPGLGAIDLSITNSVAAMLSAALLIIAFYALVDYHRIFAKALLLFPRSSREDVRSIAADVTVVFGRYLRGLGIVCLLDACATIFVLLLFPPTRPYAAALGLLAGIFYAVPYIGAIGSTALIALVALASDGGSFSMMREDE